MQMLTMTLDSPHDLPGHQAGRDILLNYCGRYDGVDRIEVRGSYEHDTFVTRELRDWDAELGWSDWNTIDRDGRIFREENSGP